ncbi:MULTISPECIES: hypothetical protein [unclassified Streptomyces]|uniref:hypothetical protein n=1 Tax=unclassified Streptomyces TaxID=2593676 RepID=UPI001F03D160|nr:MULTISPECIES: hypothetical protein [unclassified Streptomyces]MCH0563674.1 hypothetical protein [Streptomyces sp. MUM 2J]MCH0570808.1 hypothetical protein [Streptomyces sp. MUM 136J]
MSRAEREAAARRIMERMPPVTPPDLYPAAVRRGTRMLRHRVVARRLLWVSLVAAAVALTVWAVAVQPWGTPPSETTPPLSDW